MLRFSSLIFFLSLECLIAPAVFGYTITQFYKAQAIDAADDTAKKQSVPKSVLRVIFCSFNYRDNSSFLKDIQTITKSFLETRPFNEFKGRIELFYLKLSPEEEKSVFKAVEGFPPLLVNEALINSLDKKLNAVYKLAVINYFGRVSCAELSRPQKTSLLIIGRARYNNNRSLANGFLHEIGHSLGLREEYIYSDHILDPGYPNCAANKEEAREWWGDLAEENSRVGYIPGCCANMNYIRPTIASLMNDADKAKDFGPVNERYLRQVLEEGS